MIFSLPPHGQQEKQEKSKNGMKDVKGVNEEKNWSEWEKECGEVASQKEKSDRIVLDKRRRQGEEEW